MAPTPAQTVIIHGGGFGGFHGGGLVGRLGRIRLLARRLLGPGLGYAAWHPWWRGSWGWGPDVADVSHSQYYRDHYATDSGCWVYRRVWIRHRYIVRRLVNICM
jgi:hypothetical protein